MEYVCVSERKEDGDFMPNNHRRQHKGKIANHLNIYPTIREKQRIRGKIRTQNSKPHQTAFKEITLNVSGPTSSFINQLNKLLSY